MKKKHEETVKALEIFFEPGDVFEVRLLGARLHSSSWEHTECGYFRYEDIQGIPGLLGGFAGYAGAYFTLNPVSPALLARSNARFTRARGGGTTSDADVLRRNWMLVDVDPVRPAGISATDEERGRAFSVASEIEEGLASMGFPAPVAVSSGNGAQLLYRVSLPADDGKLVSRCLKALGPCSTEHAKVDMGVHNAARICRLPGTWNRKGDDMPDRPHRMAELMAVPARVEAVSLALLERLAGEMPEKRRETRLSCGLHDFAGQSPSEAYNASEPLKTLLERHGWTLSHETAEQSYWMRPGKGSGQHSATFNGECFYVFSDAAAPFAANTGYSPFGALAVLEHGGDHSAAAKACVAQGLGQAHVRLEGTGVDISGITGANRREPEGGKHQEPCQVVGIAELVEGFSGLSEPVVHGLVRRGEVMNFVSAAKIGKSWLTMHLAASVASGMDWLGFPVEHGRVLHVDNELKPSLIASRYIKTCSALGLSTDTLAGSLDILSLRGRLMDVRQIAETVAGIAERRYSMVVVDALYRAIPQGVDENDNAAIAQVYNLVDALAEASGAAIVLVHHSSKGSQGGKSVTDVGSGAGSQSRAADTHMVLRRHEEPGVVVMDAEVRSFAPIEPMPLRYSWPLFSLAHDIDPGKLDGAAQKPQPAKAWELEEFVSACLAVQQPCSRAAVIYEAERLGISARRAADMLAVAVEKGLCASAGSGAASRYSVVEKRDTSK